MSKNWNEWRIFKNVSYKTIRSYAPEIFNRFRALIYISNLYWINDWTFFRCLTENGWDLERATVAFNSAQREGKIPLTAFEKWSYIIIYLLIISKQYMYRIVRHGNSGSSKAEWNIIKSLRKFIQVLTLKLCLKGCLWLQTIMKINVWLCSWKLLTWMCFI